MDEGKIDDLTMEQYLTLTRGNQAPGMVKPEIRGDVNLEIKRQFMRELREGIFSENKNDDAHKHAEKVLDIINISNILGVDRLSLGTIDSWDILKKAFIQKVTVRQYITVQVGDVIHNFKQEGDETLYRAWEWYNDLLYKCTTHEINSHQKVNIFYSSLSTMNRQLLDSQGLIPGITRAQALTAIQTMADHSQKWHDGSSSRSINNNNSNTEGIAAIVSKLDSLGYVIQVEC
ncbi:hypothetical protein Tco_0205872 [Tanacetum coccineum]